MSSLQTGEEYKAIAAGLDLPAQAFIDGSFRPAQSGATFEILILQPESGSRGVAACAAPDIDFAVEKAREAFEDGRWSQLAPGERKAVL